MRTIVTIIVLIVFNTFSFGQKEKVTVDFNKNIEFLGYIIDLVDPADNDVNHPIRKIIHQYPEDLKQPDLGEILQIAANIDYSTLIHLMYFLPEFPLDNNYEVPNSLKTLLGYTSKQDGKTLDLLVHKTNSFYKVSKFEQVWNHLSAERKKVTQFIRDNKPKEEVFHYMEAFYGKEFRKYHIIPSLTIWTAGFGVNDSEKNMANFVLGPLRKNYEFDHKQDFLNLTIHEFGHSFVNSVVAANSSTINESEKLFIPLKESMTRQGYSNWLTCLIEHFVRAGEVIVNEQLGNKKASEDLLKEYSEDRDFQYLSFIVEQLKKYRIQENYSYSDAVQKVIEDLKSFL